MSGILSFLYIPFGYVLKLCGILSGNHYVLSLLFFALIMQIILFPLGIKQQKSSVKMAKINPKVQLVREKYKGRNDRPTQQKMNMEIQDLYTKEGYSQLAGCLPLLIQLPIILALFGVIRQPLTYSVALANDEFNVDNQYKTAIIMLEEGKSAIEKSGILSQKYNDDQKDEKIKQTDLTKLKKDFVMLQKYFGATLDDKDVWNKEAALTDMRSNYEMDLTSFMIKDGKKVYNDLLQNLGVTEKITTDFETKDMDEMPSFTFFGNFSFLDTPKSYIGFNVLMIIPILVFLSSFYSGILTKKFTIAQGAPEANMPGNGALMKWGMPAMSAYFSITFPAA
ncbi:MAG: membrane protein insertase YidC, partial [Clostridia bacterium]